MKVHKEPLVYNMTDDNMDIINYQVQDATKEAIEEATRKQVEQHQKVQDQLITIQQLLETMKIASEKGLVKDTSTSPLRKHKLPMHSCPS
jgi:hypothetical protein